MPSYTDFLALTLPELNEFVNSWNQPLNQNAEDIDDWLQDLHLSLVGAGTGSTWATLRGTMANLADRLAVSLKPDGTLDVSGSDDIVGISTSSVAGVFTNPRDRLNASDLSVYAAHQPVAGGRFAPMPTVGPSVGFPPESLDAGMALRSADFGARTDIPISSPHIPWAPGLVTGGANPLITANGIGRVHIDASANPAVFNIDGYIFRLREMLDFDWNLINGSGPPGNGVYVWLFVERNEASYNNSSYRYNSEGGYAAKDLRKLQSGAANGVTSGSTFTCTAGLFDNAVYGKVKAGDVLVITAPAGSAGEYVVAAIDGTTPHTKLTIKGTFKASASGVTWYVRDNAHPNVGAVVTDAAATTQPPFVAGRVYFGRACHSTTVNPTAIITFAAGGVYDSGWVAVDANTDFAKTFVHDLGVPPTSVTLLVRENAAGRVYQPLVRRVVMQLGGENDTLWVPALNYHSSEIDLTLSMEYGSTNPAKDRAFFTDLNNVDHTICELRVIARR